MRVLICGDRNWKSVRSIARVIRRLLASYGHENLEIVEGGANGADLMAAGVCVEEGIIFHQYPAFWKLYGRAAGPIRNRRMLTQGKPDRVCAFHANIDESKGTKDMMKQARKKGIPVKLFEK